VVVKTTTVTTKPSFMNLNRLWIPGIFLFGMILSACERSTSVATDAEGFVAPTIAATEVIAQEPVGETPVPAAECENVLSFDKDITIPDGTEVTPGEAIDKRWQVRNNGSCDWTEQYTVRLISGPDLGAPESQGLYPARSGSMAIITMALTAPTEEGTYRSAWQAYTPDDVAFGDPFYIEIMVVTKQPTP